MKELAERHLGQQRRKPHGQNTHGLFMNRKEIIVLGAHHGRGQDGGRRLRGQSGAVTDCVESWRPCERYYFKYKRSHWKVLNSEHHQIGFTEPLPALWENGPQRDMEAGRRLLKTIAP